MRSVIVLTALLAVLAIVLAGNPYANAVNDAAETLRFRGSGGANALDLSGQYSWAFSVTDQIKAQIKASQDAIQALSDAVDQAKINRDNAYNGWQASLDRQRNAQTARDSARSARDNAQTALDQAVGRLQVANAALDQAVSELKDATDDFSRKDGVLKLATNVRDYDVPRKTNDISDLCSVLGILGTQHGSSDICSKSPIPTTVINTYDANLRVAVDDSSNIFLNGNRIFSTNGWNTPFSVGFTAKTGDVLSIQALNANWGNGMGNPGAIIGNLSYGAKNFATNARNWRCTAGYINNPSAQAVASWPAAVEMDYPSFRLAFGTFPQEQKLIWKADNYVGGDTVTCATVFV